MGFKTMRIDLFRRIRRVGLVLLGALMVFVAVPATQAAADTVYFPSGGGNFVFRQNTKMNQNVAACSGTPSVPRTCLVMQGDGNLVLYDSRSADPVSWRFGRAMWSTHTNGAGRWMHFQTDGNFVVYRAVSDPVWSAHSQPGYTLRVQTDGNLVVYDGTSDALWSSRTHF
jgi:hypothetical protein